MVDLDVHAAEKKLKKSFLSNIIRRFLLNKKLFVGQKKGFLDVREQNKVPSLKVGFCGDCEIAQQNLDRRTVTVYWIDERELSPLDHGYITYI